MDLREDDDKMEITMPSDLTNTQRIFCHELAKQLGLKSKSSGKGEERRRRVRKVQSGNSGGMMGTVNTGRKNPNVLPTEGDYKSIPRINVGKRGEEALRKHLLNFPPTEEENCESVETGSSLVKKHKESEERSGQFDSNALTPTDFKSRNPSAQRQQQLASQRRDRHERLVQQRIQYHKQAQMQTKASPQYKQMMKQRRKLPAFSYAQDICNVLRNPKNQVVILTGDTGCGKSTQVPQFLLDDPEIGATANILVTQPRRISAISVAERVASERCEQAGQTVGYSVRLESCLSKRTQLLFMTPGVLMKKLHPVDGSSYQTEGSVNRLEEYTHIIMDEIHERDKNTEFLMIALQDLLDDRDDLQLILMSATMPTRDLAEYWCGVGSRRSREQSQADDGLSNPACMPVELNIPGRTFPVQEFFLEDVLSMTGFVSEVPGEADMQQIENELLALVGGPSGSVKNRNGGKHSKSKSFPLLDSSPSMSCPMCGKEGFRNAEEFGSHVALCDGTGESLIDLEDRLRGMEVAASGFDIMAANPETNEDTDDMEAVEMPDGEFEEYDEDGDDPLWDGESPFLQSAPKSSKPSLSEEDMMTRYQTMYDDEATNYELTMELVKYIVKSSFGDGAILIFFSGWGDISEFSLLLDTTPPFNDRSKFVVHPLHSGIPSREQRNVFVAPPMGVRKIVLSTNIAETSLTIEDIAFVIDTGRAKVKSYDPHLKTSTLQESWISQASAKQRKGRAGRCKAGVCFHLFSRRRHENMCPFVESELIRTPLEEICLQCKRLKLAPGGPDDPDGIPAFLSKAMTPPHSKSVLNALELLVDLGAMDEETNELTDLGQCLSALSLEPRVGKMVLMSNLIGCARASSSMAVAMSYKSPFAVTPVSMRRAADNVKLNFSDSSESDQITSLNVLKAYDAMSKRGGMGALQAWCRNNFLNFSSLRMISDLRRNVSRELQGMGFPPSTQNGYHNRGDSSAFLQASICAGLYPNVAFRRNDDVNFSTMSNRKAKVHLSSVNGIKAQPLSSKCKIAEDEVELAVFGELVKGKAMFTMENTTHIASPLPILLLCGQLHIRQIQLARANGTIQMAILSLDDWLVFKCEPKTASALVVLRQRLDSAFKRITADPSTLNRLPELERSAVETLNVVLTSAHRITPKRAT